MIIFPWSLIFQIMPWWKYMSIKISYFLQSAVNFYFAHFLHWLHCFNEHLESFLRSWSPIQIYFPIITFLYSSRWNFKILASFLFKNCLSNPLPAKSASYLQGYGVFFAKVLRIISIKNLLAWVGKIFMNILLFYLFWWDFGHSCFWFSYEWGLCW